MSADPGTLADMAPFARAGLSNDTICGWFQPPAWHTRNISTSADGLASGLRLAAACALGGWTLCMMDLVATPCLATVGFVYQGPMGCLAATITGETACCCLQTILQRLHHLGVVTPGGRCSLLWHHACCNGDTHHHRDNTSTDTSHDTNTTQQSQ
jgi:hypothetical protein